MAYIFERNMKKFYSHFNHAELLGILPSGRVPKKWLVFFGRKMKKIRFSFENAEIFRFSHRKCYTDLTATLLSSRHFWKCNAFFANPDSTLNFKTHFPCIGIAIWITQLLCFSPRNQSIHTWSEPVYFLHSKKYIQIVHCVVYSVHASQKRFVQIPIYS